MRNWILAAAVLVAAGVSYAAVELVPYRVEEQRAVQLVKDDIGRSPGSMRLTFSLKGAEAADAVKYGDLKLEEAVDDKGTKLIPDKDRFNDATKFKEFSNDFFRKSDKENKRPVAAPQIDVDLKASARGATKIAKLKGTVSLINEGTIKTVEAAGVKIGEKKKLDIPEKAGVTVSVEIKKGEESTIKIDIGGDENAIDSIEVLDAGGNKVSGGMSSWSMNGKVERSLMLMNPFDSKMKIVVKVGMDRKVTKVPFDLKDITLP